MMIVLNSRDDVDAFASSAQMSLGSSIGMAAGTVGMNVSRSIHTGELAEGFSSIYSYSRSRGLFMGLSLEAGLMLSRPDLNKKFYGADIPAQRLLRGHYDRPKAAEPLYAILDGAAARYPAQPHTLPERPLVAPGDHWAQERSRRLSNSGRGQSDSFASATTLSKASADHCNSMEMEEITSDSDTERLRLSFEEYEAEDGTEVDAVLLVKAIEDAVGTADTAASDATGGLEDVHLGT